MDVRTVHIVSLNVPYPADYGGVIDIFYKIKALSEAGIEVILHSFKYGREESPELEKYCRKVYYYKRKTGFLQNLHWLPYIIYSRRSKQLLENLVKDDFPIIFEGLHCCFYLNNPNLKNRIKMVRMHNIEHRYYFSLAWVSRGILKKIFFILEGTKLLFAQKLLIHASSVGAISQNDFLYLDKRFSNTFLLNPFHSNSAIKTMPGKGNYFLYHGNLSVPENDAAVHFLIIQVFSQVDFPVIIAGHSPGKKLSELCSKYKNISLVSNPAQAKMQDLISGAQAIVLFTFQATGLKLKLIDTLYQGRFCIANSRMIEQTGLEEACLLADSPDKILEGINSIQRMSFTEKMIAERLKILENYHPASGIEKLVSRLFD